MTADRSLRLRVTRAAQGVVLVLMALVVLATVLFVLSVNSVFGADWRRQVVTTARRIEPVNRLLTRPQSASPTAPATARTPRPTPVASLITGTPQAGAGSVGVNVGALTDGQMTQRAGAWRTREGQTTAELRFGTSPGTAERVVFAHSAMFPPETWAKDVEVWLTPSQDAAEIRAGAWSLAQTTGEQAFTFPSTPVHAARLRILSNHGSREYTSLAEFALQGEAA